MINIQKADKLLILCGLRDCLSGTDYIRRALRIYRPGMMITKELYPAIAAEVGSTAMRVERSMRHAIETGFDRCGFSDDVLELFGNTLDPDKGKPTVSEFLARIAMVCNED